MSKSTIYSQACQEISGFQTMGEEFIRKLVINGRGKCVVFKQPGGNV